MTRQDFPFKRKLYFHRVCYCWKKGTDDRFISINLSASGNKGLNHVLFIGEGERKMDD